MTYLNWWQLANQTCISVLQLIKKSVITHHNIIIMCTVQYQQIIIMLQVSLLHVQCILRADKQKIKLKDWKYQVFESFQDDNSPKTPARVTLTFLQLQWAKQKQTYQCDDVRSYSQQHQLKSSHYNTLIMAMYLSTTQQAVNIIVPRMVYLPGNGPLGAMGSTRNMQWSV